MNYIRIAFAMFICLLSLDGCNFIKEEEHKEEASESHHEERNKEYVSLTKEQFKGVKIQLGSFEKKNLTNLIKASGVLDLPPQNKASISSFMGGIITKINVIQGDFVQEGAVLATLEHPDILRLQQDYLETKSNLEYSQKEYYRQKELYDEKIVSGKKFQAAEAEYKSHKAMISSLENQLWQLGISPKKVTPGSMIQSIPVKSPMQGFVHKIAVNTGSYVEPAKEIFMIVDNHHIHIDLQIYEKDVPMVNVGQSVYFTLANAPEEQYEAKIFAVGKAFESETKSVSVHADIKKNKNKNLLPGMYVDGRIEVDESRVDALPEEAIVSQGVLKYIFVKIDSAFHDELIFKRIPVQTGVSEMGYTEVTLLEKIPANAMVVVKGTYYLAAKMKQAEEGEGGDSHGH